MERFVLDLFSGTGSATIAFAEHGHRVVRVDNRVWRHSRPEVRADVRHLPIGSGEVEFLWASPPCSEFSVMRRLRRGAVCPPDPERGLELVEATRTVIADLSPTNWAIENVGGAVPYINRILGAPKVGWRGRFVWASFEIDGLLPSGVIGKQSRRRENREETARYYRDRGFGLSARELSAARAMIPRPLADAIHRSVCPKRGGSPP